MDLTRAYRTPALYSNKKYCFSCIIESSSYFLNLGVGKNFQLAKVSDLSNTAEKL